MPSLSTALFGGEIAVARAEATLFTRGICQVVDPGISLVIDAHFLYFFYTRLQVYSKYI